MPRGSTGIFQLCQLYLQHPATNSSVQADTSGTNLPALGGSLEFSSLACLLPARVETFWMDRVASEMHR